MRVDEDGKNLIKSFESLSLSPYKDSAGRWTIGWGHAEGVFANTPPITALQADQMLDTDLEDSEIAVYKMVLVELFQSEFNALVSLVFNVGANRILNSDLMRKLNSGNRLGASKEFLRFNHYTDPETKELKVSDGLTRRRELERQMFLKDFNQRREMA